MADDKSSLNEYSVFLHDGKGERVQYDNALVAPVSRANPVAPPESDSESVYQEEFDNQTEDPFKKVVNEVQESMRTQFRRLQPIQNQIEKKPSDEELIPTFNHTTASLR